MIALAVALAVLVGVLLGLLGGGGSILAVPLLVYVAGLGAKEAIATSLLVVGVTSLAAVGGHARAGRVRWRTGLLFGAAAMTGAYLGGRLGAYVPGSWLLIGFAVMMVAAAAAMIHGRREAPPVPATPPVPAATSGAPPRAHELPIVTVLAEGVGVGLVTGLVGAGGGFLVVPALVLLGGLPMPIAVGTSLLVISMNSFAGFAGYLASVRIDWGLAAAVTAVAVVGSLVGARLVRYVSVESLRRGFGWFVLLAGGGVLAQEMPRVLLAPAGLVVAVLLVVLLAARSAASARRSRVVEAPARRTT